MSEVVQSEWETYSLGDVFSEIKNGCSFEQNSLQGGLPVTRIETISTGAIDYQKTGWLDSDEELGRYKLERNDILLSHINSMSHIGKVALKNDDRLLYHGMNLLRLRVNKKICDPIFAYNLLTWDRVRENLRNRAKQAINQASINVQDIKTLVYSLPPFPEQQKIATIFSSVDDVIEKTRAQIDKLKDLKTGMMQELLTQGVGHTEFKDSPVGRVPASWEVESLDLLGVHVIDGDRGKEYPKEADFRSFDYCLFLSAKNVTRNGFVFSEQVFIEKSKDERLGKGKLKRGDIVMTTRGTVGNIAYFEETVPYEHIRINSGMAVIRNQSSKLDTNYLHMVMNAPLVSEQINLLAFGSAQPQLTVGIIKGLLVPQPTLEEQKKITKNIDSILKKLSFFSKKLECIESLKKALMQDLLTGKVRVKLDQLETTAA